MRDVVKASNMNVLACTSHYGKTTKFSDSFMELLKERTGLEKKDLEFCEFQLYPAYKAKFVGLDKQAIGGPG